MTEQVEGALSEADRAALKWVKLPSGINALEALEALEAERASYEPVHECCAEGTCPDPLYRRLRRD